MIKKKLRVIIAASMLIACMSGCGNNVEVEDISSNSSDIEDTEETTESTETQTEATTVAEEATTEDVATTTDAAQASTEVTTETVTEADAQKAEAGNSGITFDIRSNKLFEVAEDGKTLVDGSYDEILFDENTKNAYPELVKSVNSYDTSIKHSVEQFKDENISEIRERYAETPTMPLPYVENNSMIVSRADSDILSFETSTYTYTAGVHGWYGSSGANFDVKTGKELKLFDIIKDREALVTCVQDKIKSIYPNLIESEPGVLDAVIDVFSETNVDNVNWCIKPEGITLFFNPEQLGSYAAGMQVIPVAFSENPELFKDSIHKQEGNWAITGSSAYLDTDGDGSYESLRVEDGYDHEGDNNFIKEINVVVNDNSTTFELFSYKNSCTWIKSGSNYFLYVTSLEENDWKSTHVYKLSGETVTEVGAVTGYVSASKIEYAYDESGFSSEMTGCMYNPDKFYFGNRMNILSTYSGVRLSRVGEDGMPAPIEEWFKAYATFEITSKVELELEEVDETGNVVTTNKLDLGTPFTFYRTDGETYVDLQTHKGTIYRVHIDKKEWPQKINGQDVEKIFEGLVFAG